MESKVCYDHYRVSLFGEIIYKSLVKHRLQKPNPTNGINNQTNGICNNYAKSIKGGFKAGNGCIKIDLW